jgi:predicted kinase
LLGSRKESSCQLIALLTRRLEAGSALLYVASRSRRKLTDVVLALAYDLGDLWVVIVEDVVKQ